MGYAAYVGGKELADLAAQVNKAFDEDRARIAALEAKIEELTKPVAKPATAKKA